MRVGCKVMESSFYGGEEIVDHEKIKQIVDGYIEELGSEFGKFSREMVESAEGVQEEIENIDLPKELFMDLLDPQEIFRASKTVCSALTDQMLALLQALDTDEEQEMRRVIKERLRGIVDSLLSC